MGRNTRTIDKISTAQALILDRVLTAQTREAIQHLPRPTRACGRRVPDTLDGLSIGDLASMQSAASVPDLVARIADVVLGVPLRRLLNTRADVGLGLIFWAGRELERIGKMFDAASLKPTPIEERAGIGRLQFGPFSMIDWYAQRMHYQNHDDAARVSWLRVYECMRMDNQRTAFERRLRDIMEAEQREKIKK